MQPSIARRSGCFRLYRKIDDCRLCYAVSLDKSVLIVPLPASEMVPADQSEKVGRVRRCTRQPMNRPLMWLEEQTTTEPLTYEH